MPVDAGTIYSEVRVLLDKVKGDLSKIDANFDKFVKSNEQDSKKVEKNWDKSFKKVNLAGVASIAAVTLAFKKGIQVFAETEQSLANVAAVANATAEEYALLEKAAEEAGATTRFTARESADALFFLASAGLDAKESTEALNAVLLAAGATGSDLAFTAETITATLSQFNIEAKDAARVSNVFAAANANSQATMDKLANALRQVGPIAGTFGIELEEVVGSLQELFNAGFRGEQAGRALKSAFADLADESSPVIEKLNELGVSFDQVNPLTVGFTGAIEAINNAGIDASQAIGIFGKIAGPQLATLLKAGAGRLRELETAVTGTDEAARQYEVQNNTLAGSIDKFKSATETASNSVQKKLSPAYRVLLDLGGKLLLAISKLPGELLAFVGGAGAAALAVGGLIKALGLLGVSLGAAGGPLTIIAAALGAVTLGLAQFTAKAKDAKEEKLSKEFDELSEAVERTNTSFIKLNKQGKNLISWIEIYSGNQEVLNKIIGEFEEGLGFARSEVLQLALSYEELDEETRKLLESELELAKAQEELQRQESGLRKITSQILGLTQEDARLNKLVADGIITRGDAVRELIIKQKNLLTEFQNVAQTEEDGSRIRAAAITQIEFLRNSIETLTAELSELKTAEEELEEPTKANVKSWREWLKEITELETVGKNGGEVIDEFITNAIEKSRSLGQVLGTDINTLLKEEIDLLKKTAEALITINESEIDSPFKLGDAAIDKLLEKIVELELQLEQNEATANRFGQAYEQATQEAQEAADEQIGFIDDIEKKQESANDAIISANEKVQDAIREAREKQLQDEIETQDKIDEKRKEIYDEFDRIIKENVEASKEAAQQVLDVTTEKLEEQKAAEEAAQQAISDAIIAAQEKRDAERSALEKEYSEKVRQQKENRIQTLEREYIESLAIAEALEADTANIHEFYENEKTKITNEQEKERGDIYKKGAKEIMNLSFELFKTIADAYTASIDRQIEDIERLRDKEIAELDAQLQRQLEQEGLIVDSLQRRLDEAIEKGDEEEIAEVKRLMRIRELTEENEAKKVAAIDESNKKLAELQYKKALSDWELQGLQIAANIALGISQALALGPFAIPAVAIMTALGIVQVAAWAKAKPQPPKFQTGGAVLPTRSDTGTNINVAENGAGELMFNAGTEGSAFTEAFAEKMADIISRKIIIRVPLYMDGKVVAQGVADRFNNGNVRLKVR